MSTEAKNIHLDAALIQQLQEEAARLGKPLDVVASEAVQLGLKTSRKDRLERLLERTHSHVAKLGLTPPNEESVVDTVHQDRKEREHGR